MTDEVVIEDDEHFKEYELILKKLKDAKKE